MVMMMRWWRKFCWGSETISVLRNIKPTASHGHLKLHEPHHQRDLKEWGVHLLLSVVHRLFWTDITSWSNGKVRSGVWSSAAALGAPSCRVCVTTRPKTLTSMKFPGKTQDMSWLRSGFRRGSAWVLCPALMGKYDRKYNKALHVSDRNCPSLLAHCPLSVMETQHSAETF